MVTSEGEKKSLLFHIAYFSSKYSNIYTISGTCVLIHYVRTHTMQMPLLGASHHDNSLPSQHVTEATTMVKMNDPKLRSGMVGVSGQQRLNDDDGTFNPLTIKLIDHTIIPSENSPGIWARSAKVVDYVIVSGSRTRAGAYVAWNCSIETFEVG